MSQVNDFILQKFNNISKITYSAMKHKLNLDLGLINYKGNRPFQML